MIARLLFGLGDESRVRKKLSKSEVDPTMQMLALIYDRVTWLVWSKTKDGQSNTNQPKSLYEILTNGNEEKEKDIKAFDSAEDFRAEWNRLVSNRKEV